MGGSNSYTVRVQWLHLRPVYYFEGDDFIISAVCSTASHRHGVCSTVAP